MILYKRCVEYLTSKGYSTVQEVVFGTSLQKRMSLEEWLEMARCSSLWQTCFHGAPTSIGVVGVKEWLCYSTYPPYRRGHAKLLSMDIDNYLAKSMASASYVELADDVVSYAGVHVGMTIFGYISCPILPRARHLLCLGHRKQRLRVIVVIIKFALAILCYLDGLPLAPMGKPVRDTLLYAKQGNHCQQCMLHAIR